MGLRSAAAAIRILLAISCAPASAQPWSPYSGPEPKDMGLQTVEPIHVLRFDASERPIAVDFSPDGAVLYVQMQRSGINLWGLGLGYWPEWLGALVGLAALVLSVKIVRRLRTREPVGSPLCRRCGYRLTGLASAIGGVDARADVCPECGVNLARRPPRTGRGRLRRSALPAAGVLVLFVGYGAMHAAGVPRAGWLGTRHCWVWERFDTLAQDRNWAWARRYRVHYQDVLAIDTKTGEERGRVCRRVASLFEPMAISPDGATLVLLTSPRRLQAFDMPSGRRSASLECESDPAGRIGWSHIAGVAEGGGTVYAVRVVPSGEALLVEWNLRTGEERPIVAEPTHRASIAGRPAPVPRRFAAISERPGVFASWPDFLEAYHKGEFRVNVYGDGEEMRSRSFLLAPDTPPMSLPAFSRDGTLMFISAGHRGVDGYDVLTGESLGRLRPPDVTTFWHRVEVSPDSGHVFVPMVVYDGALVRDIRQRQWTAWLRGMAAIMNAEMAVSRNGERIAAWGSMYRAAGGAGPQGPWTSALAWYDLSDLKPSDPPPLNQEDAAGESERE